MKEKHQNGVIQHEPFEVPEGTLMFLIKATCDSVGLELYLVFAEHMNCHGWPNAASTQFSAVLTVLASRTAPKHLGPSEDCRQRGNLALQSLLGIDQCDNIR